MYDCYRLLQEDYTEDPWRVLLVTLLLNQTRSSQVGPVVENLLHEWPNAAAMADAPLDDLANILEPLGLKKRGGWIPEMSSDYMKVQPTTWQAVLELTGCGRFAAETWRMLLDEDRSFMPKDLMLRARMLWWRLDECKMLKNWNGATGLFFPGTERGFVYIGIPDGQTSGGYYRDFVVISREAKKKERWQELPDETEIPDQYQPLTIAKRWLTDNPLVSITSRAQEALMLLIINAKGKFAGKFADDQLEVATKAAPEGSTVIANKEELLAKVPEIKGLLVLFNSIVAPDDRKKKFEDTIDAAGAADLVMAAAEAKVMKVKEQKPARELGAKEKLRAALVAAGDTGLNLDEMATACGGNTDHKRVSDYMCYLKNAKYAGTAGPINIYKIGERYTVSAEAKAAYDKEQVEKAEKEKTEKETAKNKAADGGATEGTENAGEPAAA